MTKTTETSRGNRPTRLLHTMLRVTDLNRSIAFYTEQLGMHLLRTERYPEGQFTLAFLGYGSESDNAVLELTHNWDGRTYSQGDAYGHIALECNDIYRICDSLQTTGVSVVRQPGPMSARSPDRAEAEHIAFIQDPDGYRIELIQR